MRNQSADKTKVSKRERREYDRIGALIEEEGRSARRKQNQALVGKCFRYWNSYGQDEHWWLYARVDGTDNYWPYSFQFQKTSQNEFRIETLKTFTSSERYKEISEAEFSQAWSEFLVEMNALRSKEGK